jgi:hypothetical protein
VPARAAALRLAGMNTRDPGAVVLDCRRCGAQILSENINLSNALAKCHQCHAVFDFADQLSGANPKPPAMSMPLPQGLSVSEQAGMLRLEHRWFRPSLFFYLLFCIVWNTFLVLWYMQAGGKVKIEAIFTIAHVAAGVGLTYWTIAGFVNRTIIGASAHYLTIRHQPLPWPGKQHVAVRDLQQLFCQEHASNLRNDTSVSYSLNAVLQSGRKLVLVKRLPEADLALYLEHALEKHLGITNRPVPGEVRL